MPMTEISCYAMDLYCDWHECKSNTPQVQLTGRDRASCVKEARKLGWIFHKNDEHTCPKHRNA